jgi:cytochrome bd-type quinol oxidase subunit 2
VNRYVARGVYLVFAVVVCPLLAWNLAVDATNRGFGWRGFFILLLGLPVIGAVLAAVLLRRRRREATFGAIAAVLATFVLVVVLIFVTLSSR